jgi:hypothetical protein
MLCPFLRFRKTQDSPVVAWFGEHLEHFQD